MKAPAGKDDERGVGEISVTPRTGTYHEMETAIENDRKSKRTRMMHLAFAVFILLNIIALYILHFADRGDSNSSSSTSEFKSSVFQTNAASAPSGAAVSLSSTGSIQVGAGTTAYLNAVSLPATDMAQYITFAPMGGDASAKESMMSYQRAGSAGLESVLTTISIDESRALTVKDVSDANVIANATIRGIAPLSSSMAVVLTSTFLAEPYPVELVPVSITKDGVSLIKDKTFSLVNNSIANFLSRLSDSEFAVAVYEPYSANSTYFQRILIGKIDAEGSISMSKGLVFGDGNDAISQTSFGRPQPAGKTTGRLVVPWYHASDVEAGTASNASVGLCLHQVSYNLGKKNVTAIGDVCNTRFQPTYLLESMPFGDNMLILAFYDRANNYAPTVALVEFSTFDGSATFRSSMAFTDAAGAFNFGNAFGFSPMPTLAKFGDNLVSVGFLNPSSGSKPTIKVLRISSDSTLEEFSPLMPLVTNEFTLENTGPEQVGGSVTMSVVPALTGFVVAYSGSFGLNQYANISYAESFGAPVGVVAAGGSDSLKVAMSGVVKVDGASLQSGKSYYAATDGKLYAAQDASSNFIFAADNTRVISQSAFVGVAVSSHEIFVSPSA